MALRVSREAIASWENIFDIKFFICNFTCLLLLFFFANITYYQMGENFKWLFHQSKCLNWPHADGGMWVRQNLRENAKMWFIECSRVNFQTYPCIYYIIKKSKQRDAETYCMYENAKMWGREGRGRLKWGDIYSRILCRQICHHYMVAGHYRRKLTI